MRKGQKNTEETKRKISLAKKGKKKSAEHKRKIGLAFRGRKLSEEHKKKIGLSLLGRTSGMKGKKHKPESRLKASQALRGEKAPNWMGGISKINHKIRGSILFRLWREAVYARDNWTCQKYHIRGGTLHPHHIINFAQVPELRFAVDNGITLSDKAHREFHRLFGRKNNTKEQLEEFLNTRP